MGLGLKIVVLISSDVTDSAVCIKEIKTFIYDAFSLFRIQKRQNFGGQGQQAERA